MRTPLVLAASTLLAVAILVLGARMPAGADEGEGDLELLEDHACLQCHGFADNEDRAPFVDGHLFLDSAHKEIDCVDCHGDYEDYPHPEDGESEQCAGCHDEAYEAIQDSVHGALLGDEDSPETSKVCAGCHGLHEVFPIGGGGSSLDMLTIDRRSRLYPLNVPKTCGNCHFAQKNVEDLTTDEMLREKYTDDTHGHALLRSGLVSAPTCVSCHGGHGVLAHENPQSRVHPDNVSKDCGTCHVGIFEQYSVSVHGKTERGHPEDHKNLREPATCTDCHQPHGIRRPDANFKLQIIEVCAGCHGGRGATYRGTYHGRVTEIGFGEGIASCDECHTAHSILPSSDPHSSLSSEHRVETCAKCHEGANRQFASYMVHADPEDEENYPTLYWARVIMRGLIFFTWTMWGIHVALWLHRALRDRKKIKAMLEPVSGRWYRRWPWTYRAIHLVLVFSFLLLALTGLPLRFHDAPWSAAIFTVLGGPENVRYLHRFGAILTAVYTVFFLAQLAVRLAKRERGLFRGPNTLLPGVKDLKDMRGNLRYFIKGGEPPKFDRWTYWEKFDFLAEAWGVFFIGTTGLIMWFPVFFTQYLPGQAINLAHILHSYEALLATGFIFSIHFFNANLRPGKFPVDPMFLTGRISEEELRHERPAEYERMRQDGRLETEALPPPNERLKRRARVMGGVLLSFGLFLLLLMFSTLFL